LKTTLAIALFWILYASCGIPAEAVCTGTSVSAFGAKGDGRTEDTAAIQSAIIAAAAAGGGSVVFNVARYFTTGSFVVPAGVVLCGAIEGPFDLALDIRDGLTKDSKDKLHDALGQATETTRRRLESIKLSHLVKPAARKRRS
jgi:hypothetical protein